VLNNKYSKNLPFKMSYFADHLAWQQRVAQEFKAQSSHLDTQMY
jgi:hypothetical protein